MAETNSNNQKALLTSAQPSTTIPKKHKKTIVFVIMFILILIITIIIFLLTLKVFNGESGESKAGMIGLWPTYGGGLKNQQTPPNSHLVKINNENIQNVAIKCTYLSPGGIGFTGYPTIDSKNNSYFTDLSGYITCINLDTCNVCWRQHVGSLLGYSNITVSTFQTLTLFQDSDGIQGLLFAAPTRRTGLGNTYPINAGCYALAVHLNDGSFWFKVTLGEDNNKHDYQCASHGFYVEGKYAYGGFTQGANYDQSNNARYIGRFVKIDIDKHKVINVWYPFPFDYTNDIDEYNMSYSGVSIYNYPSIIDKYVIFGTCNLQRVPNRIADCLTNTENNFDANDYLLLNESNYVDMCGNNQSNNKFFRCLEKGIAVSSLIILNKYTFEEESSIQLQGLDMYYGRRCFFDQNSSSMCPGYPLNKRVIGFNADLTALASYKNKYDDKLYVVASQKSNRLHVFEISSGKLMLSRKYGPQTSHAQFGMAVDEKTMIGITAIHGGDAFGIIQRYKISPDLVVCGGTGVTYAFDLNTGNILWQVINPYGLINDSSCYNDTLYDQYIDYTLQTNTTCEFGQEWNDNINIHIPPKGNATFDPIMSEIRAQFYGPATIVNDMVFIPSDTGDVWIHDLYNGTFIHHFQCPNTLTDDTFNRPSIKGGISVVNDRIVFYCGSYYNSVGSNDVAGNIFVSVQLI
eukprot:480459_1